MGFGVLRNRGRRDFCIAEGIQLIASNLIQVNLQRQIRLRASKNDTLSLVGHTKFMHSMNHIKTIAPSQLT